MSDYLMTLKNLKRGCLFEAIDYMSYICLVLSILLVLFINMLTLLTKCLQQIHNRSDAYSHGMW